MAREYGAKGRVGVATPQANPTVEPEVAACLPPHVTLFTTRLASACADPKERFQDYFDNLDRTLQSFDTLRMDALAFACTAASYLVGHARERRDLLALSAKRGYRIVSGGQAIVAALNKLGARRVAVGAPYPRWVLEICQAYYEQAGFEIVAMKQIETQSTDTRAIYELSGDDAIAAVRGLDLNGADTLLFTGSGMPSFRAVIECERLTGLPTLSTNICLGWALCEAIGQSGWAAGPHRLTNGWQARVAQL